MMVAPVFIFAVSALSACHYSGPFLPDYRQFPPIWTIPVQLDAAEQELVDAFLKSGKEPRAFAATLALSAPAVRRLSIALGNAYQRARAERNAAIMWNLVIIKDTSAADAYELQLGVVALVIRTGAREATLREIRRLRALPASKRPEVLAHAEALLGAWAASCTRIYCSGHDCGEAPVVLTEYVAHFPDSPFAYDYRFSAADIAQAYLPAEKALPLLEAVVSKDRVRVTSGLAPGRWFEHAALDQICLLEAEARDPRNPVPMRPMPQ